MRATATTKSRRSGIRFNADRKRPQIELSSTSLHRASLDKAAFSAQCATLISLEIARYLRESQTEENQRVEAWTRVVKRPEVTRRPGPRPAPPSLRPFALEMAPAEGAPEQPATQPKKRKRYVIASDASRQGSGMGLAVASWVGEDGAGGTLATSPKGGIALAELNAIEGALRMGLKTGRPIVILSDSMRALILLGEYCRKSPRKANFKPTSMQRSVAERIVELAKYGKVPVAIRHIRGHEGHPLNEAADGVARTARRRIGIDCSPQDAGLAKFDDLERRIANDGAAAFLAAGRHLPETLREVTLR